MNDAEKILFVDDDPNILQSFSRRLRNRYAISTANGAREAFKLIEKEGPFAVIVSDMRMPEMNGVDFLRAIKQKNDSTVRVMLTGNIDQNTAVKAVNDGHIFQFLNKPCSPEEIANTIDQGLEQYRLLTAEKDLLQNTLTGSVKLLTEILAMADPEAFGSISRQRLAVRKYAPMLGISTLWEVELATMLRNIGRITLPAYLLEKLRLGEMLEDSEQQMVDQIPTLGSKLLLNIPRMDRIAEIIAQIDRPFTETLDETVNQTRLSLEARVLRIIIDYEVRCENSIPEEVLSNMRSEKFYDPHLLSIFSARIYDSLRGDQRNLERYEISTDELFAGQRLVEPVKVQGGLLLFSAGTILTDLMINRIRNHQRQRGLAHCVVVDRIKQ